MARFTSIGMPKKTFVASAAEEAHGHEPAEAGPSKSSGGGDEQPARPPAKKRRRGTRGREVPEGGAAAAPQTEKKGWGRDPNLAKRMKMSSDHSAQRREKRQHERNSGTTCFACRSVGHAARDCPNVLLALEKGVEGAAAMLEDGAKTGEDAEERPKKGMKRKQGKKGGDLVGNRCYRCNGTDHSLGACPEPIDTTNPTPYATCYICLGTGHLSSLCPSNPGRGIYVNGGSCKVCGSTAHRAKDCPEEAEQRKKEWESRPKRGEIILGSAGGQLGADEDDFMVDSRSTMREMGNGKKGKGKREKHLPNNNGVRGLYQGKNRSLPVEGAATLLESAPVSVPQEETSEPVAALALAKSKKKVVAF